MCIAGVFAVICDFKPLETFCPLSGLDFLSFRLFLHTKLFTHTCQYRYQYTTLKQTRRGKWANKRRKRRAKQKTVIQLCSVCSLYLFAPIYISVLRQQDVTSAKIDSKSNSYMGSDGQHAPPYAHTLQTMYKTYPWHIGTCTYLLVQFVLSETFIPTRYQTSELRAETTHYGAG